MRSADSPNMVDTPPDRGGHAALIEKLETSRRRANKRNLIATTITPVAFLAIVVVIWELAVRTLEIPPYLLPPPSAILRKATSQAGLFLENTSTTLQEIAIGYAVAAIGGIALGVTIAVSRLASLTISPLLVAAQAVPTIAVAPLLLVWFGFGLLPKVMMVAVAAFFPIVINTTVGITSIEPEKVDLGRILGFAPATFFRKVTLPNALPNLFSGLKIGVTMAVIGGVVAEFVAANGGLGYLLLAFETNLDTVGVFVTTVLLAGLGLILYAILTFTEALSIPWHVSKRER